MVEIIDPHNNEVLYRNWVNNGRKLNGVSDANRDLAFLSDMEKGKNTQRKTGRVGFARLKALKSRMTRLSILTEKEFNKPLCELTRDDFSEFIYRLVDGKIRTKKGEKYNSTRNFIVDFKSFWHWHMKVQNRLYEETNGKKGSVVSDITDDVMAGKTKKSDFVYFDINELQKMVREAKFKYKAIMLLMFDSGIRAPKELSNVRVKDVIKQRGSDVLQLNIREESSKTFGRKIKLHLSSKLIAEYIASLDLKSDDFLFKISPSVVNQYIKRIGRRTINKEPTMYDFRHCSACHYVSIYDNHNTLMYRFGWTNPQMIKYYTNFIGVTDDVSEDDLLSTVDKTELQKELEKEKHKRELLEEQFKAQDKQLTQVTEALKLLDNHVRDKK